MCEYTYENGEKCPDEPVPGLKYCILHCDLPDDPKSDEYKEIKKAKEKRVNEKIEAGDYNFEGAKLVELDLSRREIHSNLIFTNAVISKILNCEDIVIKEGILFKGAEIRDYINLSASKIRGDADFEDTKIGNAFFIDAKIGGTVYFNDSYINGEVNFEDACIGANAEFWNMEIGGNVYFRGAEIRGDADFGGTKIGTDVRFEGAIIRGDLSFDQFISYNTNRIPFEEISRKNCKIHGDILFNYTKIFGQFQMENADIKKLSAQEEVFRKARTINEELGDRITADEYFVKEMQTKWKQKYEKAQSEKKYFNQLFYLFEKIFGDYFLKYGTGWKRVLGIWFAVIFLSSFFFWTFGGVEIASATNIVIPNSTISIPVTTYQPATSFFDNVYFSILTITTLGYGDLHPKPEPLFQFLAGLIAIYGAFTWAAFIAIIARIYMR